MNRRPTPETDALASEHRGAVIWPDFARRLENERDEAQERVKELTHENEILYRRLESVHEVYRLSSVCRELKAENEQLKQQQP